MQYALKVRETLSGAVTAYTSPIDVSGMPLLTVNLTTFVVTGTSAQIDATVQTSDDLETWTDVGSALTLSSANIMKAARSAASDVYLRYVRVKLVVTGTTPLVNFSLYINTFSSQ